MTPTDPRSHGAAAGASPHGDPWSEDGVVETSGEDLHNPDVAHEHKDVNLRAVIGAALVLIAVAVFTHVAMWGVFVLFERRAAANDPQLPPMAVPAGQLPPAPRLLTNEPQALEALTTSEAQSLEHYGWTDRTAGAVHIPIEEAKKLILQRGFPVRPDGLADPSLGTNGPARGESSSGRAIPVPRAPKAAPPAAAEPIPEAKKEGKG